MPLLLPPALWMRLCTPTLTAPEAYPVCFFYLRKHSLATLGGERMGEHIGDPSDATEHAVSRIRQEPLPGLSASSLGKVPIDIRGL
jgi:hypothetical protein